MASDYVPASQPLPFTFVESLKRFVPAGKVTIKTILKNSEAFAAWAGKNNFQAIIIPLAVFALSKNKKKLGHLKKCLSEDGIILEAGGRELSSLVPRRHFLFHRDYFRMDEGIRKKDSHFCATNPAAISIIGKEGEKLFRAADEINVFHLWPQETAWCSCPSCRAFTRDEQYRIGINAAADVLAKVNPGAIIVFYENENPENPEAGAKIPLRKNTYRIEKLPGETEFTN